MDILLKPVITEKMTNDSELFNRYGFLVDVKANKIQIKNAIESAYGVAVNKVRTMNCAGKLKSRHTKAGMISGRTNATKKAIVELAKGETLDVYGNI
jgi:large subunit ribosomal protein L23